MKLWSFQSIQAVRTLQHKGVLTVNWERYTMLSWKRAYQWMCDQMEKKGIDCQGNAPIWAWHSCGGVYGKVPTLGDASMLLGRNDVHVDYQTIELDAPDELILLSLYSNWNRDVLDYFIIGAEDVRLSNDKLEGLFHVYPTIELEEYASVQATLPLLKLEWVQDIRPLNLPMGDNDDFDENETV